jgi:hypothetical protein
MANVTPHLLIRLQAEGDDRDEAEGEPFPALHYLVMGVSRWVVERRCWGSGKTYAAGKVTAVLTLHGDVFGAFEGGVEDWWGISEGVWRGKGLDLSVPWVPHVKKKNMVLGGCALVALCSSWRLR